VNEPVHPKLSRRRLLQAGALGAAAAGLHPYLRARALAEAPDMQRVEPADRKLLFVFCAFGGASVIDGFLPIAQSQVGDAALAAKLNTFPDSLVEQAPGSNLRHVGLLDNYSFYLKPENMGQLVRHHGQDMAVIAHEVSSVNHAVGQQRSLSGAGLDRGRTLMESMALRYGGGMPLPNCNMASGGYIEHGVDSTVPARARHELIASPGLFATGTHGYKGLAGVPASAGIERARKVREQLDRESVFARTFAQSPRIQAYLQQRRDAQSEFEGLDMIDKLLLLEPGALDPALGLTGSELAGALRGQLPLLEQDDLQAQIGLGFLLAYHGMSASVTIGLRDDATIVNAGVLGTPIAFDFSHSSHRMTQNLMWCRTASLLDTLITLLKTHDYLGDPGLGKMWDRSLIYVATEFGRSKSRPSGSESWGSAHDLNNGSLLISPLIKGNRVYGGVDPKTGLSFGFDPKTGEAQRDKKLYEGDVYSLIAHALDIGFPGRVDFPSVVRG
jgi:hypothetical protein